MTVKNGLAVTLLVVAITIAASATGFTGIMLHARVAAVEQDQTAYAGEIATLKEAVSTIKAWLVRMDEKLDQLLMEQERSRRRHNVERRGDEVAG